MERQPNKNPSRSFRVAFLIGVGVMAAVDEIIFHQLLRWHHFYDRATPAIALISDGILHASELIALIAGFFLFSDLRRNHALVPIFGWSGFFCGLGGFQLFDGIIDHKVLRLHQIRYGVKNLYIYDLAWNVFALLLILIGLAIYIKAKSGFRANSSERL